MIEEVVRPLEDDPRIPMSTLIYRIVRDEEITHPNAVKTVADRDGFAIYFSRATIPFFRDGTDKPARVKVRTPTITSLMSLFDQLRGINIADVPAVIGGMDLCIACADR